jgi:hypothetical protein
LKKLNHSLIEKKFHFVLFFTFVLDSRLNSSIKIFTYTLHFENQY